MAKKKLKNKVITFGTVTNNCNGIVGNFNTFNKDLADNNFGGKRVKIVYELITEEQENLERELNE